jgi:type IV secretory pathway VirB10-like protein
MTYVIIRVGTNNWLIVDQERTINSQYTSVKCNPGLFSLTSPHVKKNNEQPANINLDNNQQVTPPNPPSLPQPSTKTPHIKKNNEELTNKNLEINQQVSPPNPPPQPSTETNLEKKKSKKRKRAKKDKEEKKNAVDEEYLEVITADYNSFLQSHISLFNCEESTVNNNTNEQSNNNLDLIVWGETINAMQRFSGDDGYVFTME